MPKRPRDANQLAKAVVDMTTGWIPNDSMDPPSGKAKGGHARAAGMSAERRKEIAHRPPPQGGSPTVPRGSLKVGGKAAAPPPPPELRQPDDLDGDNLPIMRGMNSASVDLIYLDPPFNSKANYAAPIGSKAAGAEFKDTWTLSDVDVEWINLIETKHPALYRVLLAAMTDSTPPAAKLRYP